MELIINPCPLTGVEGDPAHCCHACGSEGFHASVFDREAGLCRACLDDPSPLLMWAQRCRIPETKLPRNTAALYRLRRLRLRQNAGLYSIDHIPEALSRLARLEELQVAAQPVGAFPDSLGHLQRLRRLSLQSLELESIPDFVLRLRGLTFLSLTNNRLTVLPEALWGLTGLKTLVLANNRIESLPEQIGRLEQLERLYLWNNRLRKLPQALARLERLRVLHLAGNPLQERDGLRRALAPRLDELILSWNEVKILNKGKT